MVPSSVSSQLYTCSSIEMPTIDMSISTIHTTHIHCRLHCYYNLSNYDASTLLSVATLVTCLSLISYYCLHHISILLCTHAMFITFCLGYVIHLFFQCQALILTQTFPLTPHTSTFFQFLLYNNKLHIWSYDNTGGIQFEERRLGLKRTIMHMNHQWIAMLLA